MTKQVVHHGTLCAKGGEVDGKIMKPQQATSGLRKFGLAKS